MKFTTTARGKRVMSTLFAVMLGAGLCFPSAFAQAQGPTKAMKRQNVTWYYVQLYAFKRDKRGEALQIAKKYFIPAARAAGLHNIVLFHVTGPWDVTVMGPLAHGPSELALRMDPEDVAFFRALVKLAGSKEKAQQIWARLDADMARRTSYVAYRENKAAGGKN